MIYSSLYTVSKYLTLAKTCHSGGTTLPCEIFLNFGRIFRIIFWIISSFTLAQYFMFQQVYMCFKHVDKIYNFLNY